MFEVKEPHVKKKTSIYRRQVLVVFELVRWQMGIAV
jgi:hypothetical protein